MFNGKNSCWFPTNEYVTVNKQRMELDWNRDFFPPKSGDDSTFSFECLQNDDIPKIHTF